MNIQFKNKIKQIPSFFKDVRLELKKVNWPTRNETLKYTFIVILASVTVAIFLGALDFVFSFLLNKFIIR